MNVEQISLEVRDRLEIADALYRFGAGVDLNSEELLISALTPNAILDLTPGNQLWGLEFPVLQGRNTIIQALRSSVGVLDTTHYLTNPRIEINGDNAKLYAIVEAQHLPPNDRSRHCLMKNQDDVSFIRDGACWAVNRLIVNGVWFTGKPSVLLSK